ncbi:MAG: TAT-variant-translocated molybdopterin oxidoreductase [Phycisphaerae bacterium]|nr:TAT-variant-translocated molybdopterin oxidoreductase [Phycisphaerae bacterium]
MPPVDHHVSGRQHWLSLEQYADSPEFAERVAREFPSYDPAEVVAVPRRRFLQLMGASMALAGLTATGCRRFPVEKLAPFAHRDPDRIPGSTEHYASFMEMRGVATGLVVTSFDGRPIKIEGNPLHPYSLGAADVFAQASVLSMYDPDRSRQVMRRDGTAMKASSWAEFDAFAKRHFAGLAEHGSAGLAVLSESSSSPTLARMRTAFLEKFPQAQWFEFEPVSRDNEIEGLRLAYGKRLRPLYRLDQATSIALFDADLLGFHPARLRHARDWATGRRSADQGRMNRMYVVESAFSTTGSVADHRFGARPGQVERMVEALAAELGIAGSAPTGLDAASTAFIKESAEDLTRSGKSSLIAGGPRLSQRAQVLVQRMNHKLGSIGTTITFVEEPGADRPSHMAAIRSLTEKMNGGGVETLLILGGNAAYDAPGDVDFASALGKAKTSIHLSYYADETSQRCTWHVPQAHFLESWNDGRAWDGTLSIGQPLILPMFDGRTPAELLAGVCGEPETDGYTLVRKTLAGVLSGADFESSWATALHDGVIADSGWKVQSPAPVSSELPAAESGTAGGEASLAVVFRPDARVYDGRFANNGWLQETPDPLTKVTWDNPALISVADGKRLGIDTGDVLSVSSGGKVREIAAAILPGQPEGVITLTLGGGRAAAGHIGNGVGFNTNVLRTSGHPFAVVSAKIERTGQTYKLASTQDHHAIDPVGRSALEKRIGKPGKNGIILREASLAEYRSEPNFAHRDVHGNINLQLFQPPDQFNEPHAWGMAIDLTTCIGCNACVVACQAENNVPVVGKEQVSHGREMHWLRIDRYFKGEPTAQVEVVHQPMMCVHCENAPCEQVCPVAATTHDSEGLNVMVYNRCIGTRYCSNNCPYKVRRFNYMDWHSQDPRGMAMPWLGMPDAQQKYEVDPLRKMGFNPDVSVRMRGVMEKCTYCVQRISTAKIARRRNGEDVRDGDIVTACQQACPTQAIVFGNLNDPNSRVAKLHQNQRAYGVLAELNTRPRTKYLAKIRNPLKEGATT